MKEAQKLGFKRIFIPKNNIDGWEFPTGIEVVGVSSVKEAIQKHFKTLLDKEGEKWIYLLKVNFLPNE